MDHLLYNKTAIATKSRQPDGYFSKYPVCCHDCNVPDPNRLAIRQNTSGVCPQDVDNTNFGNNSC